MFFRPLKRMIMPPTLAIIIVSWNVRDLLRRCLSAVDDTLRPSGIAYETLVVDNASSDGTPAMLRAEFPQVRLLETGANLGFSGGNNVALRALLSPSALASPALTPHASRLKYVLLLNPDAEPLPDAIPALVRYLDLHPGATVVGPQLRYPDGSVQSSRRRFPARAAFFWESTPFERLWPSNPWARRYRCDDAPASVEQRVGWLVGAALLVRADAIARAGLLDEGFFMYSEELEWQRRLQATGGAIVYLPEAIIIHHEGQSSAQIPAGRHLYFQRSKLRLAQMLYGPRFAALLRLFLLLCYAGDLASEGAKWLLGHRRDLRRKRINTYLAVLKFLAIAR